MILAVVSSVHFEHDSWLRPGSVAVVVVAVFSSVRLDMTLFRSGRESSLAEIAKDLPEAVLAPHVQRHS